jgi:hypothetical protein
MLFSQGWLFASWACLQAAAMSIPRACNESTPNLEGLNASTDAIQALSVLQEAVMRNLHLEEQKFMPQKSTCSLENAAVRRDW